MPLDETVKQAVIKKLEEYEGRVNHLYRDSKGNVTVGVGHLIPNKTAVAALRLYTLTNNVATTLATKEQKEAEFETISKQPTGHKASWYKQHAKLVMKDADINAQRDAHISSFYGELTRIYTKAKGYPEDFDKLPKDVQKALFDMIFNLGASKIVNVFKSFDAAVKAGNWSTAATESRRSGIQASRNEYVQKLFEAAAKAKESTEAP